MIDRLIEFFLNLIEDFLPIFFVTEYNRGVLFRGGKFRKVLNPGIHWKIPFIDKHDIRTVVTTTLTVSAQSITTSDGQTIVIKSVVKYNISNIRDLVLNVYDPVDAISDTTQAIIKEQITSRTWKQCADNQLDNIITKKTRNEVKKWGIDIEKVTLTDIGIIRSLRLFNETTNLNNA